MPATRRNRERGGTRRMRGAGINPESLKRDLKKINSAYSNEAIEAGVAAGVQTYKLYTKNPKNPIFQLQNKRFGLSVNDVYNFAINAAKKAAKITIESSQNCCPVSSARVEEFLKEV